MKRHITLGLVMLMLTVQSMAQDSQRFNFEGGFDMVSRYIWRGLQFSDAPNIQPYATASVGGLSLTGWGSYATGKNYAEIDLYLSYTLKGLTLSVNDYYNEDETDLASTEWTEWRSNYTGHLVEACLTFTTPGEKHPLTFTASTFIYGADRTDEADEDGDGDLGNQRYSTYFELTYPFSVNDYSLSAFAGGTFTSDGYYSSKSGLVNMGIQAGKDIKISDQFSVPLALSLIYNPANDDSFFVVKLSF